MVVRIRITRTAGVSRVRPAISGFLTLVAVACFILGTWILCAGLGWAGAFVVQTGLLSHWQIWMALGIASQLCSFRLGRLRTL